MNLEIANRLVEYRKKAGLSQEELADKLGISRQAISKWERVEASPDTDNLIALANLYGISLDELIYGNANVNVKNNNKEEDKEETKTQNEEDVQAEKQPDVEYVEGEVIDDEGNSASAGRNKKGFYFKAKDDGDNTEVVIDKAGVHVTKDGKTTTYDKNCKHKHSGFAVFIGTLNGVCALLATIAYLWLGFALPYGFANFWPLFICIPVIPSFFDAIRRRRFCVLNVPCIVTATYCFLGMFLNLWHPMWILFLLIPVYYTIFGPVDKAIHHEPFEEDNKKENN